MTLTLVEGIDRAGKSTYCRALMAESRERPRVMLHFTAPPRNLDGTFNTTQVLSEVGRVLVLASDNADMDFVLDRGHLSCFVYHARREGLLPWDMAAAFRQWERDWASHIDDADLRLVMVDAPGAVILTRDDGKSTYTRALKTDTLAAVLGEQHLFRLLFADSRFEHKAVVDTGAKAVVA